MPTRHRIGTSASGLRIRTAAQFEPRMDRPLGIVFARRGIAKKDEDGIPETAGDKPAVATDDLRDAVLKGADRFEQILETDPVGSRCHAYRFARHDGDLPAFGFVVFRDRHPVGKFWQQLPRDLRRMVRHLGLRGLSAEQIPVVVARDRGGATENLPTYLSWRRTLEAIPESGDPVPWIAAAAGLGPYQHGMR